MSKTLVMLALTIAAALPAAVSAKGVVEVRFVEPDQFSDIGFGSVDRESVLKSLGDFMVGLDQELPDGQTLKLYVLNIDLAGRIVFERQGDLRVLRGGADWPRVSLRYVLQTAANGAVLKSGQVDLVDMNYMSDTLRGKLNNARFGYEKRMLQRWFRQDLLAPDNKPQP